MIKNNLLTVLVVCLLLLLIFIITPELGFGQPPPPPSKPIEQAPIDGGLALLAAAGGAFGLKKLRSNKE